MPFKYLKNKEDINKYFSKYPEYLDLKEIINIIIENYIKEQIKLSENYLKTKNEAFRDEFFRIDGVLVFLSKFKNILESKR